MLNTPFPEILVAVYTIAVFIITIYTFGEFSLIYYLFTPNKKNRNHPILPDFKIEELPSVTVQLPMYNEQYVAKAVIDSCAQLEYPSDRLEIQVVDDSTDETVQIVQECAAYWNEKGINVKVVHRENRQGFKAGALRDATPFAQGDFLAIFDADFRPNPDFLLKTMPYFQDEQVGIVQTRWGHINRDYSLMTKCQTIFLDMFFMVEQQARSLAGFFLRFNGSGGIWRKKTIEDAGGWSADTLSEDLDLAFRAQLKDWKVVYDNSVEAPAEVPVTMLDFKAQQYRWTKGKAQVIRKLSKLIKEKKIPLWHRLHIYFDLFNILTLPSIVLIATFSIPVTILLMETDTYDLLFSLFSISLLNVIIIPAFMWRVMRRYNETNLGAVLEFLKMVFPFSIMFLGMSFYQLTSMVDGFFSNKAFFHRTSKYNITSKNDSWSDKVYSPREVPILTFIEGGLALFYAWCIYFDITNSVYGFFPFHITLTFGFGFVFFKSFSKK